MKKIAIITVAVCALGLAACNKDNAANNAANETAVENTAATDVNAAATTDVNAMACSASVKSRLPATELKAGSVSGSGRM